MPQGSTPWTTCSRPREVERTSGSVQIEGVPVTLAYVALGANLGDPARAIARAQELLSRRDGVEVRRRAPLFRTEPVGGPPQPWFVNTVIEVETELSASSLMDVLLGIESEMGRVREERWGPRSIDLDLVYFGDRRIAEPPHLEVPHPRRAQRRFVLEPLARLRPELLDPEHGATVGELLQSCPDTSRIEELGAPVGEAR